MFDLKGVFIWGIAFLLLIGFGIGLLTFKGCEIISKYKIRIEKIESEK